MPRLRTAPGGARRWNASTPRSRGGWFAISSPVGSASSRPLGERSVRPFGFARPWVDSSIGCPPHALPDVPRNTVTVDRSVSTRSVRRHLAFCDRETAAFASAADRLALLFRDRGSPHRHDAVSKRRAPLCRICLRSHPRAPPCFTLDPRWVHSALGQVRCEPVVASGSGGFMPLSPTGADPWFEAPFRCARVCEQRPGYVRRTPRGRPCVTDGTEIPKVCAPAFRRGRASAFALSRCFRVARGRLLHLAMKSPPATRTHLAMPPREGSTPPDESEVLSAAPRSGERALPVALPDGIGVGARGAFFTRRALAP
jgi:hypothetical protein